MFENLARVRWGYERIPKDKLEILSEATQIHLSELSLCDSESQIIKLKGLILAQNERQRRGLGMQVERTP